MLSTGGKDMSQEQDQEQKKLKVKLETMEPRGEVAVYHGDLVLPDEFDDVFENAEDIAAYFSEETILCAVVPRSKKEAYFVTVAGRNPFESHFTRILVYKFNAE